MPIKLAVLATAATFAFGSTTPVAIEGQDLFGGKPVEQRLDSGAKATVVAFLSARCPCSVSHEQELKRIAADFPDFKFVAVHSNSDESAVESAEHFKKLEFPFPVIQDEKGALADRFGALKTPHIFVLDAKGETLFQGGMDSAQIHSEKATPFLRTALMSIREGKSPEPKVARALGCVIKR